MISFKDFKKIEMRVGIVEKVEDMPQSEKLMKMQVDIGGEKRQVVAGLKGYYKPEELEGKKFVFVTNLEPATLMGEKSEAMVLAAVKDRKVVLIQPEKDIDIGATVE